MDRIVPKSIGDVLRDVFRDSCMEERLNESKAKEIWCRVVGQGIANQCKQPYTCNGQMIIGVTNASLRHELTMNRNGIMESINKIIGKETIKEIRFTS